MNTVLEREIPHVHEYTLEDWFNRDIKNIEKAAKVYHASWSPLGLSEDIESAYWKMEHLNPAQAYVVTDPEDMPLGILHTLLTHAPTIEALYMKYPEYDAVIRDSVVGGSATGHFSVRLCFSMSVPDRARIADFTGGRRISIPEKLFQLVPDIPGVRMVPYSRVDGVQANVSTLAHVYAGMRDSSLLGPVGLHEHYGGIAAAVLHGSRHEDRRGGGSNVVVYRPKTVKEIALFSDLREKRRSGILPPVTTVRMDARHEMHVFQDVAEHITYF